MGEEKRVESRMTSRFQAAVIKGLSECRQHSVHWLPTPFLGCFTLKESLCSSESLFAHLLPGVEGPCFSFVGLLKSEIRQSSFTHSKSIRHKAL